MAEPQIPMRSFFSLYCDDLQSSQTFYCNVFGYKVAFESNWFVHLQSPQQELIELGLMKRDHELVPTQCRTRLQSGMLTIVVANVDAICSVAQDLEITVEERPTNLFYGQRRMLLRDPNGHIIDVSSECPPDPEWIASLTG